MQIPDTHTETTTRTIFPTITRQLDSAMLLTGCFKAMEETGEPGILVLRDGRIRYLNEIKVTVTPVPAEPQPEAR